FDTQSRNRRSRFHLTSISHRLLKLEDEIVDWHGRPVAGKVMRIIWVPPEIACGDKAEAGRFDFFAQRAFLDAVQGLANGDSLPRQCGVISDQQKAARL